MQSDAQGVTVELKIPDAGESIEEVRIVEWLKQEGDQVEEDENLVELETDKASLTLPAPAAGVLEEVLKHDGESASVGETIGRVKESDATADGKTETNEKSRDKADERGEQESGEQQRDEQQRDEQQRDEQERDEQQRDEHKSAVREETDSQAAADDDERQAEVAATPSARRALRKHGLSSADIEPAGDRIRREDVERHVEQHEEAERTPADSRNEVADSTEDELTEVVPMSALRRRIAERLVEAQQRSALLTTFNQIDMSAVMELRQRHGERFDNEYEVDLGYMSFFVKAAIDALKQFPAINAKIRGDDIVYHNYYHVGIAIGSERGLVVPVLRYAERMSFAEIEAAIDDFAERADNNRIQPQELQGGTFTISNGGVYGSLLSTPIVNPPQSGVLGMHAIENRPVARNGEVVVRPMMYVALSYDHRIVDGREAVLFLRRSKEAIEEPARMLIEV